MKIFKASWLFSIISCFLFVARVHAYPHGIMVTISGMDETVTYQSKKIYNNPKEAEQAIQKLQNRWDYESISFEAGIKMAKTVGICNFKEYIRWSMKQSLYCSMGPFHMLYEDGFFKKTKSMNDFIDRVLLKIWERNIDGLTVDITNLLTLEIETYDMKSFGKGCLRFFMNCG